MNFAWRIYRWLARAFPHEFKVAYGPEVTQLGEDVVEEIAGIKLKRTYKLDAPKGVNGRNSDNTKILQYLGSEPSIRLKDGMTKTYEWIESQVLATASR